MTADPEAVTRALAREMHANVCGPDAEVCCWVEDALIPCSESDGPDMLAAHLVSVLASLFDDRLVRCEHEERER